jgi:hypothetical protein
MTALYNEQDASIFKALTYRLPLLLSGGYCRDMLLGRKPKDMDFMLIADGFDDEELAEVVKVVNELALDDIMFSTKFYGSYQDTSTCIASFYMQTGGNGEPREVNILRRIQGTPHTSAEAVSEYNYTFNQCVFEPNAGVELAGVSLWASPMQETEGTFVWVSPMQEALSTQKIAVWNAAGRPWQNLPKYRDKFPDWRFFESWDDLATFVAEKL